MQERALRFVYEYFSSSYEELFHKATVYSRHADQTDKNNGSRILQDYEQYSYHICAYKYWWVLKYSFRYVNILNVPQRKSNRYGKTNRPQLDGITFETISGMKIVVFPILKVSFSPWTVWNVVVLLADNSWSCLLFMLLFCVFLHDIFIYLNSRFSGHIFPEIG